MMDNFLLDKQFLKQIDADENRETYIRITALDLNDYPRETIEGKATGGSVNIDGTSAIRRSCSLSLVVPNTDVIITDEYWCYNNKFKLEVGLKNNINDQYPPILWFNQGIYLIASFGHSITASNTTISISGKDKMCRLNGEISGNLPMSVDFGTEEIVAADGTVTINKIPIYTIIQQAVRTYGQERLENIVINDLDEHGYELWEYRGVDPMFIIIEPKTAGAMPEVQNISFNKDIQIHTIYEDSIPTPVTDIITFDNFAEKGYRYYSLNTLDPNYNLQATKFQYGTKECCLVRIESGETAGYHATDLIYASDLILNAGETVTSLLDKLKTMLGEYEYFYDLNGRFVFQRKQNYVQNLFTPFDGKTAMPIQLSSFYSYEFEDNTKFTTTSNNPQITNVKNDFSVWGSRKSVLTGDDLPIHTRYAIDTKPTSYNSLPYYRDGKLQESGYAFTSTQYDWRELIYRMAIDFYRHNEEPSYLIDLEARNPQFLNGKTGYEQYYSDLQGYWRQLYNPTPTEQEVKDYGEFYGKEGSDGKGADRYWNKNIHKDPTLFNFWFDFIDTQGELNNFSVKKIGARSKVINEKTVKAIYYKETPEVLFVVKPEEQILEEQTYTPIIIQSEQRDLFYNSTQGLSAIAKTNELVNTHIIDTNSISITSIPIFYLEPNTRIKVKDQGDYTLTKISYSLSYNGTMTISGVKIIDQFY